MYCNQCGNQNPASARFCSYCGAQLGANDDTTITFIVSDLNLGDHKTEEELTTAVEELDAGDAMLFVKRGSNTGATYLLDSDVVRVGRSPDSEVFLDDVTVSRSHAEFRRENKQFVIVDVGSLNGTYVNGDRVDSAKLARGDEVQIGKFKLVFLRGNAE